MILVTGSRGNVGSAVVEQLAAGGHRVRALVRDVKEGSSFPTTVDVVAGDLDNVDSLVNAMKGVDRMFMLAPFTPSLVKHDGNMIDAAKRSRIKHVVKLSALGAQYEAITLARWHRTGEKSLESSGMAWTHVRPSGFFTNTLMWAGMIRSGGSVYHPTGEGKLGIVDPRDIAAVAVKALTENGHEAKSYEVTGPAALSTSEQCDVIGRILGKPIHAVTVPDAVARDAMIGQGMPLQLANCLLEFLGVVRAGQAALVTDTVQNVTGRAPWTFESWVKAQIATFR
jgi:uncharacterized protein YbjT (DUF2867 family)